MLPRTSVQIRRRWHCHERFVVASLIAALVTQLPSRAIAQPAQATNARAPDVRAASANPRPVPMRDITMRGLINPARREMNAQVIAAIGTPFGRVPIHASVRVRIACNGSFRGTVSYSAIVRFFARLKGVDLITVLDGDMPHDSVSTCAALTADSVRGNAVVERTELRGAVLVSSDSVRFLGPAWMVGDSSYHSQLRVTRGTRAFDVRINLHERAPSTGDARPGVAHADSGRYALDSTRLALMPPKPKLLVSTVSGCTSRPCPGT